MVRDVSVAVSVFPWDHPTGVLLGPPPSAMLVLSRSLHSGSLGVPFTFTRGWPSSLSECHVLPFLVYSLIFVKHTISVAF